MSKLECVLLGAMPAWTPGLVVLAIALWWSPIVPDREPAPPTVSDDDAFEEFLRAFKDDRK